MDDDLPPLPDNPDAEILDARKRAVDALLHAESLEAAAHRARRHARAKEKHYERLLQERMGQMSILEVGE